MAMASESTASQTSATADPRSHGIDSQMRMDNSSATAQIIPSALQRPSQRPSATTIRGSTSNPGLSSPTLDFYRQHAQAHNPEARSSDQPSSSARASPLPSHSNGYGRKQTSAAEGRGRQPVPEGLMAKANATDGNFAVMQMSAKPVMDARYLAAKRTSELTQAAAMMAGKSGYQSVKRSKLAWNPLAMEPETSSGIASDSTPFQEHQQHSQSAPNALRLPVGLGPNAAEVKAEQARLLTFLRTLQPLIVVDQICKALAYFGGIPGAPPQPDDAFPSSARANGPGSLLVGWLSEIFPPADLSKLPFSTALDSYSEGAPTDGSREQNHSQYQHQSQAAHEGRTSPPTQSAPTQEATPVKRGRGRPKGSKSTKTRKDKGMKKLASAPAPVDSQGDPSTSSNVAFTGLGYSRPMDAGTSTTASAHPDHAQTTSQPGSSVLGTPGSANRKRGRPKGSKNRPKTIPEPGVPESSAQASPTSQNTGPRGSALEHEHAATELSPYPANTSHPISTTAEVGNGFQGTSNWTSQPTSGSRQSSGPSDVASVVSPSRKRKSMPQTSSSASDTNDRIVNDLAMPQPQHYFYSSEPYPGQAKRQRVTTEGQMDTQSVHMESQTSSNSLAASPVINRAMGTATPTQPNRSFHSQSPGVRQQLSTQVTGYNTSNQQLATSSMQQQRPLQAAHQAFQPQATRSPGPHQPQPSNLNSRARRQLPGDQMSQQQQQLSNNTQHGYFNQPRPQQTPDAQFAATGPFVFSPPRSKPNKSFPQHTTYPTQSPDMPSSNVGSSYTQYAVGGENEGDSSYLSVNYDMSGSRGISQTSATSTFSSQSPSGQLAAAMAEPNIREQMYQAMGRR